MVAASSRRTGQRALHVHHALHGPHQQGGERDERGVVHQARERHDTVAHLDPERFGVCTEERFDDLAPDLLGDVLVIPQEHLQQVGAADDPLECAIVPDDRQPLDPVACHDARGAGERGVGCHGDGWAGHQLAGCHRAGLVHVGGML